jgi:hypothetical protein
MTPIHPSGLTIGPPQTAQKTMEEIVRLYCAPKAYWHSIEFLSTQFATTFTDGERLHPRYWLTAITKYLKLTGQEMPAGLQDLHRDVEAARGVFQDAQDRAWGNRQCPPHTPPDFERKEAKAWDRFSEENQAALGRFLSGKTNDNLFVALPCPNCKTGRLGFRKQLCSVCAKLSKGQSNRLSQQKWRSEKSFRRKKSNEIEHQLSAT